MDDLKAEVAFFHDIAPRVIALVAQTRQSMALATNKGPGDYATAVDVAVEELIVDEIHKRFPGDVIQAEEGHADVTVQDGRMWFIDPICGTSNIAKGINNFCTNIALADNKQLIASFVIDHSQNQYYWSVGDQKIYAGDTLFMQPPSEEFGIKVDIDLGSVRKADAALQRKHNTFTKKLFDETDFNLISLNSSLGMTYTAIGKTDGFIAIFNHPWDSCAGSFLIQQAGGVLTDPTGKPWTITSVGVIAGRTPEVHKKLLDIFLAS